MSTDSGELDPPDSPRARLAQAVFGRYNIGRELGRGGMAVVFAADDLRHSRKVAIKVLRPDLASVIGADRFLREIEVSARLRHPHIVPLFDSGRMDLGNGLVGAWYAMPLVDGPTLRQRLAAEGRLTEREAVRIAREIADALAHAHDSGAVHRDIKPENILLEGGHATVADFGIARVRDDTTGSHTTAGTIIGTPAYMSPEQATGEPVDGKTDVYALGCVLFEMLAGQPPFAISGPAGVIRAHLTRHAPSLATVRSDLSPGVVALVAHCLAKDPSARPDASTVLAALDDSSTSISLDNAAPSPKRPRIVLRAAGAILVLALAAAYIMWSRRAPAAPGDPATVTGLAVLPFAVSGGDSLGLRDGLVNLLSTKLDGAGPIRTVDPRAVLGHVSRAGNTGLDPERGAGVARRFDAPLYVLGGITEVGGQLQITAGLYDSRRGLAPVAQAAAQGPSTQLFALVDSVATQLLGGYSGRASRLAGLASVTTASLPALKAYLEGDAAQRNLRGEASLDAFQRAVTLDSTFALAWYRLSVAAEWLTLEGVMRDAARKAEQYADRLPPRERTLLAAMQEGRTGNDLHAEEMFHGLVHDYPDDIEAWTQLAELEFHLGPRRGKPISDSKATWERVLTLAPETPQPLIHLIRIAALMQDRPALDSLLRIATSLPSSNDAARSEVAEEQAIHAWAIHDSAQMRAMLDTLAHSADLTLTLSTLSITMTSPDPMDAWQVAELLTAPSRAARTRGVGQRYLAYILASHGRFADADKRIEQAVKADAVTGTEFAALLSSIPFRPPVPSAQWTSWRSRLTALDLRQTDSSGALASNLVPHPAQHPAVREYLLGLASLGTGDTSGALRHAAELERLPDPAVDSIALDLARGLRAEVAWKAGDSRATEAILRQRAERSGYIGMVASPFLSGARERWRLAQAAEANGELEDAVELYRVFGQSSVYDQIYRAPGAFRRGALLEKVGRPAEAKAAYEEGVALWGDADPALQPIVTRARTRLRALGNST